MWNLDPPPGFQGLHPQKPVTVYHRHLPHWRQDGATYFVTYRLHDSLPESKLRELEAIRAEWEQRHPPPRADETLEQLARELTRRVDRWLDQGMGSCVLKRAELAALVTRAMHYLDGERHELACYVVMPNHVHCLVRPLRPDDEPLEDILHSWKVFSSRGINEKLSREGALWQEESFDRIVRDEEHLCRCIQYIGKNPGKAGLSRQACRLWIRPEWEPLGLTFDDRRSDA